ncbi:MAG: hypothetical protein GY910_18240 [bacterium]|nr:hypothetical protein [Deltaproteobacteria bacterium]MCP4906917.1 hypothetical protein [bacterium]
METIGYFALGSLDLSTLAYSVAAHSPLRDRSQDGPQQGLEPGQSIPVSLAEWSETGANRFADLGQLDAMPSTVDEWDASVSGGAPAAIPTQIAEDHGKSIRALLDLKERFDTRDARTAPGNMLIQDHRVRALGLVQSIRAQLEGHRSDLDDRAYASVLGRALPLRRGPRPGRVRRGPPTRMATFLQREERTQEGRALRTGRFLGQILLLYSLHRSTFDLRSLGQHFVLPAGVDIGGRDVLERFVRSLIAVVGDEVAEGRF